MAEDIEHIWN